jgi:hypothetical protein
MSAFFKMVDELGRALLTGALADGCKNAGLGDAAEIVLDRGSEADVHHIEAGGAGQSIGLCHTPVETRLRHAAAAVGVGPFIERVDPIADAMREQRHAAGVVEHGEPVPQRILIGW